MQASRFSRTWGCAVLFVASLAATVSVRAQDGSAAGGPPNDDCRNLVEAFNGNTAFSTEDASTDGFEEFPQCNDFAYANVFQDIWYRYNATCTGELKVNLCNSDFDTKVAVYAGCGACPTEQASPVACNDDGACAPRSQLTVPTQQGSCFIIRVGGYSGASGSGMMNLSCNVIIPQGACCGAAGNCLGTMSEAACDDASGVWHEGQNCSTFTCPIPPPPNDDCDDCIPLTTNVSYQGTTFGASGSLTTCGTSDTKDVWHCWIADCTGRARITTCGSTFDTTLAVYDECGGELIACNDDGCSTQTTRSMVQFDAVAGTKYYLRIAGRNNVTGAYQIQADPCRNACCINGGFDCEVILESQCIGGGGLPAGPGTICEGDSNGNGLDDACEFSCPAGTIASAEPPSGTVDARQPHPMNSPTPRQGIGAPAATGVTAEPIHVLLNPAEAGAENCFSLCETAVDAVAGPNSIQSVQYHGGGVYQITLSHAIAVGAVTTIQYDGDGSYVEYTSHPANTDGNSSAAPVDILNLIDHLNGVRVPPLTLYQCDFNRSGFCTASDIITLIDLLNGASAWDPWNNTQKPVNSTCP